jgi:hypothetical protein
MSAPFINPVEYDPDAGVNWRPPLTGPDGIRNGPGPGVRFVDLTGGDSDVPRDMVAGPQGGQVYRTQAAAQGGTQQQGGGGGWVLLVLLALVVFGGKDKKWQTRQR